MNTLKWRLIILSGHFGLLMPLNQQANKGIAVLAGVIDLSIGSQLNYCSPVVVRKTMSGITRDPLGHLLLPCPVIKVNSKLEQLNPGGITNGSDPSGLKIGASVPGKES